MINRYSAFLLTVCILITIGRSPPLLILAQPTIMPLLVQPLGFPSGYFNDPEQITLDPRNESWIYIGGYSNQPLTLNLNTREVFFTPIVSRASGAAKTFSQATGHLYFDPVILGLRVEERVPNRGLIIVTQQSACVDLVDLDTYLSDPIAGSCTPEISISLKMPRQVIWIAVGNRFEMALTDQSNSCVRRFNFANGNPGLNVTQKAVVGKCGSSGATDGLTPTGAGRLIQPFAMAATKSGNTMFITDWSAVSIRKVFSMKDSAEASRQLSTVWSSLPLRLPRGMVMHPKYNSDSNARLYIADTSARCIYLWDEASHNIYNVTPNATEDVAIATSAENLLLLPNGSIIVTMQNRDLGISTCCVPTFSIQDIILRPPPSFTESNSIKASSSMNLTLSTTSAVTKSETSAETLSVTVTVSSFASPTSTLLITATESQPGLPTPTVTQPATVTSSPERTITEESTYTFSAAPTASPPATQTNTQSVFLTLSHSPWLTSTVSQDATGSAAVSITLSESLNKIVPVVSIVEPATVSLPELKGTFAVISESILARGSKRVGYQSIAIKIVNGTWDCTKFTATVAWKALNFTSANSTDEPSGFPARLDSVFPLAAPSSWWTCTPTFVRYKIYTNRGFELRSSQFVSLQIPFKQVVHTHYFGEEVNVDFIAHDPLKMKIVVEHDKKPNQVTFSKAVTESAELGATISSVTAIAGGNPAVAVQAKRTALILQLAQCDDNTEEPIDFASCPIKMDFSYETPRLSKFVGCLIMDIVILIGFVLLHFSFVVYFIISRNITMEQAQATAHFPAFFHVLSFALLQPIVMCATTLFLQSRETYSFLVGALGVAFSLGYIVAMGKLTMTKAFLAVYFTFPIPERGSRIMQFFKGIGEWRDPWDPSYIAEHEAAEQMKREQEEKIEKEKMRKLRREKRVRKREARARKLNTSRKISRRERKAGNNDESDEELGPINKTVAVPSVPQDWVEDNSLGDSALLAQSRTKSSLHGTTSRDKELISTLSKTSPDKEKKSKKESVKKGSGKEDADDDGLDKKYYVGYWKRQMWILDRYLGMPITKVEDLDPPEIQGTYELKSVADQPRTQSDSALVYGKNNKFSATYFHEDENGFEYKEGLQQSNKKLDDWIERKRAEKVQREMKRRGKQAEKLAHQKGRKRRKKELNSSEDSDDDGTSSCSSSTSLTSSSDSDEARRKETQVVEIEKSQELEERHFVRRFYIFFDPYAHKRQWWVVPEGLLIVLSGILEGLRPATMTGCRTVVGIQAWALIAFCFFTLVIKPYATRFEGYFATGLVVMQAIAGLSTWIYQLTDQSPALNIGVAVATFGLFYAVVKAFCDFSLLFSDLYDWLDKHCQPLTSLIRARIIIPVWRSLHPKSYKETERQKAEKARAERCKAHRERYGYSKKWLDSEEESSDSGTESSKKLKVPMLIPEGEKKAEKQSNPLSLWKGEEKKATHQSINNNREESIFLESPPTKQHHWNFMENYLPEGDSSSPKVWTRELPRIKLNPDEQKKADKVQRQKEKVEKEQKAIESHRRAVEKKKRDAKDEKHQQREWSKYMDSLLNGKGV